MLACSDHAKIQSHLLDDSETVINHDDGGWNCLTVKQWLFPPAQTGQTAWTANMPHQCHPNPPSTPISINHIYFQTVYDNRDIDMCIYIYAYIYICVCECVCVCAYVCVDIHTSCIYIYIYMGSYIEMHKGTLQSLCSLELGTGCLPAVWVRSIGWELRWCHRSSHRKHGPSASCWHSWWIPPGQRTRTSPAGYPWKMIKNWRWYTW